MINIVTSVPETGNGVGSIYLNDLIDTKKYSKNHIYVQPFLLRTGVRIVDRIIGKYLTKLSIFNSLRLYLFEVLCKWRGEIDCSGGCFVVTLSSPEVLLFVRHRVKGCNLISIIWDSHEFVLERSITLSTRHRARLERLHSSCLSESKGVILMGENMREQYENILPEEVFTIRHGAPAIEVGNRIYNSSEPLKIAFAGSLYAKKEFKVFYRALQLLNFESSGRAIELHCFTENNPTLVGLKVHKHGFVDRDALLASLVEMDFGFIPYWFDSAYSGTVATSFPGKFSTYVSCKLVPIYLGPIDTEVDKFMRNREMGLTINTLDESAVLNKLRDFFSHIDIASERLTAHEVYQSDFSVTSARRQFELLIKKISQQSDN
jgi:hypothetical protein